MARGEPARLKIEVAKPVCLASFAPLFPAASAGTEKGQTAVKSGFRVDAGGHNNIKHNPVFRGMARRNKSAGF